MRRLRALTGRAPARRCAAPARAPNLGRERAVLLEPRHARAHGGERGLERGRRSQRPVELDPLARAHELDRDDVRGAVDDLARLERGPRPHRVEVLHAGRGRHRAGAGRVREHLALVDERGLRVLRDHQARGEPRVRREEAREPGVARREQRVGAALGERRELAQREPEVIERERERLPVEVAARAGLAVVRERAAGCRSRRRARARARPRRSRAHRRSAPSTCGTQRSVYGSCTRPQSAWLATIALPSSRARSRAATAPCPGWRRRSWMRASNGVVEPMKASSESAAVTTAASSMRSRVAQGEPAAGRHQVRAVDQREAFLGRQLDRREPGAAQRLAAVELLAAVGRAPLAAEHDGDVGERGEVAGGAHRAAARHDRQHVVRAAARAAARRARVARPSGPSRGCWRAAAACRARPRRAAARPRRSRASARG